MGIAHSPAQRSDELIANYDLAERALPSGLVAVRPWLAGTPGRTAVNIHCESASGIPALTAVNNICPNASLLKNFSLIFSIITRTRSYFQYFLKITWFLWFHFINSSVCHKHPSEYTVAGCE